MTIGFGRYASSALALVVSLAPTTVATAQTVSSSFAELQGNVRIGQIVVVTEETGRQVIGKVAEVSPLSLVLLKKERKRDATGAEYETWTARESVMETAAISIVHRDSLVNGTLIGLGAGFAAAGMAFATDSCTPFPYDLCYHSYGAFPFIVYPTVGAIAGALIDRAHRNKPLYLRSSVTSPESVSVSPWMNTKGAGLSLSMRF